jgi:UDP-hydrolysing UDP-N-acetyl-D-glucosamine 2-epimerase
MKKRKILYISGTRADYGLMRETLIAIRKHPKLKLDIVVTGMHLMPEFGKTIYDIKKDKFKIHEIKAIYKNDSKESMSIFIGKFIQLLTEKIKKIKPDIILLLGDRGEMLAGAIVGSYLGIPVAHIHGGEVTSTVDEISRHAITKLSHIHFPATKKSAERLIKMGEDAWRIYLVGAPGLDSVLKQKLFSKEIISRKYNLDIKKPIILVIQHPVSEEFDKASYQMRETMEAIKDLGYQSIVIYPNADAGGRKMIKIIEKYRKYPFIKIFKSIPRKDYLSLMNVASVMVGNSSSGIIEAPSFHLPFVNIGSRQKSRERAENVIDVDYKRDEIKKAIKKAIHNKEFRDKIKRCKNPYVNGETGLKIAKVLATIKINKKLLEKQLTY